MLEHVIRRDHVESLRRAELGIHEIRRDDVEAQLFSGESRRGDRRVDADALIPMRAGVVQEETQAASDIEDPAGGLECPHHVKHAGREVVAQFALLRVEPLVVIVVFSKMLPPV